MMIGDVIRKYRKEAGMTQEEMALRIGVTAPAVNKWEKGSTQPDISLLAPIARLLGITTDTLLSYRDSLTAQEIADLIRKLDRDLEIRPYADVFEETKKKLEEYPSCYPLIWQSAVILKARKKHDERDETDSYEAQILVWLERCLSSEDRGIRRSAAESLFQTYLNREDYEKAGTYLEYFSPDDPEKKRREAVLFARTGKRQEAYKALEELLFSGYGFLSLVMNDLRILYMEDGDHEMAWKLSDMQRMAAKTFEMGRYNEVSSGLDVAAWEKDVSRTAAIMQEILESIETLGDFAGSPLYRHMTFKQLDPGFTKRLKSSMVLHMKSDAYAYMEGNEFWDKITEKTEKGS
ncbi:MAG: helix-turn-helix domain-containing protein [bacterium]